MQTLLGNGISGLGAFGQGDSSILYPGQQLTPNTSIKSNNGVFTFGMGGDGNLWVTDNVRNIVLHNFNIPNRGAVKAIMQYDGNFVVYNSSYRPVWYSGTQGQGAYIVIQSDGNLVIYQNGVAKWQLGTSQNSNLVAQEAHQVLINSITPISSTNIAQWVQLEKSGQLTTAEHQQLTDYLNAAASAIFTAGPITLGPPPAPGTNLAAQNDAAVQALQPKIDMLEAGANVETDINNLMLQKDHDGNPRPQYWKIPQFLNSAGNGWLSGKDTQNKIYNDVDSYISKINNTDLTKMTIIQKKQILYYLMYPYVYFANQAINLSPYRSAGHSNPNNWGACQWNFDYTVTILSKILPVVQKLGFTNLYSRLSGAVMSFWGGTTGGSNTGGAVMSFWGGITGGMYPSEIGFRKLIDEIYRAQSDAKSSHDNVFAQVGDFFAKAGTAFWHGLALPTFGVAILALMTSGAMGLSFLIDLFGGTHLTKQIFAFTAKLFSGIPFVGKFLSDLIKMLGNWLDHWAQQIRNIFSPDVNPNKARDEEEYNQLINSKDNEIINFEKTAAILTKILNDWDSDKRDDLKDGLIKNINSRPNASMIWASLDVIDKKLLGAA